MKIAKQIFIWVVSLFWLGAILQALETTLSSWTPWFLLTAVFLGVWAAVASQLK